MGTISVFRTEDFTPKEAEQLALLLTTKFTGASDKDTKGWFKWPKWLMSREIGEIFEITIKWIRNGKFHRKHMLMERTVFNAQERFTNFDEIFRNWIKIGAGYVEWAPGPKGGIVPLPKSIAYDKCPQEDYEDFHGAVIDFLLSAHCQKTLWPHLAPSQRAEMMDSHIGRFVVEWRDTQEAREQAKRDKQLNEFYDKLLEPAPEKPPTQYIRPEGFDALQMSGSTTVETEATA